LITVFAYLVGVIGRSIWTWWNAGSVATKATWWDDAKAAIVMIVMSITGGAYLINRPDLLPRPLSLAALGLVLFYFGSR
jgi:hypothetical protein